MVLSNLEYYSSAFREVELHGARSYPPEAWRPLGRFEGGAGVRSPQAFALPAPAWARFLRLQLVSHHGGEALCTLTQVAAHGKDAAQALAEELAAAEQEMGEVHAALAEAEGAAREGSAATGGTPSDALLAPTPLPTPPGAAENEEAPPAAERADATPPPEAQAVPPAPAAAAAADDDVIAAASAGASSPPSPSPLSSSQAAPASGQPAEVVPTPDAAGAAEPSAGEAAPPAQPVATPLPPSVSQSSSSSSGGDNVFKTLAQKLKALEVNQSLFDRYMSDVSTQTVATLRALEADVALLEAAARNASAALAALHARLALAEQRAETAQETAMQYAEAAAEAAASALRARLGEMAAGAAREALLPLSADVAALRDADRASAARDLAFAAVTAMMLAVTLLGAARPGDTWRPREEAPAAPAAAREAEARPRRVVVTLRGACAALALANGALGLLLHVSAAQTRPAVAVR